MKAPDISIKTTEMKSFFRELFEYTHHFNLKLIKMAELNGNAHSEKIGNLVNHMLNAHQIWNNRITKEEKEFAVWAVHKPDEYEEIESKNYITSRNIIKDYELEKLIDYTNTKGQVFSNSVRDILFHVVNHSTYHRAQIATLCRQNGIEPLMSDYIFYKRM